MSPWTIDTVTRQRGGPVIVPRQHAPLARALPYRRAAGELPSYTSGGDVIGQLGWSVVLGERGLGDVLLALGLVQALADGTGRDSELHYQGPRPRLMQRCRLPLSTSFTNGPHTIHTRHRKGFTFYAIPERPHAWLDILDDEQVEVHAALPMRYYLAAEQALGVRLPADRAPLPTFRSSERARPFHVVFVSATSWPDRKDYGGTGFARIAGVLTQRFPAPWTFTLITSTDAEPTPLDGIEILAGLDAVDCLDVFASAEVVIGNDTGPTHLAALTERPDGSSPHVVGLYGRHAHTKWTTGTARHHAIATPFSRMLALADRCPVRDHLDDALWSQSASLADIPAEIIADFASELAGWW
ncbi:MAG: glycosyltransferase family 9 protein [Pseudonocardiaceae bacterium]